MDYSYFLIFIRWGTNIIIFSNIIIIIITVFNSVKYNTSITKFAIQFFYSHLLDEVLSQRDITTWHFNTHPGCVPRVRVIVAGYVYQCGDKAGHSYRLHVRFGQVPVELTQVEQREQHAQQIDDYPQGVEYVVPERAVH